MEGNSGQLEFIEVSWRHASGERAVGTSADAQRTVRSMAMRHYRSNTRVKQGADRDGLREEVADSGTDAWRRHRTSRRASRRAARDANTALARGQSSSGQVAAQIRPSASTRPPALRQIRLRAAWRIALVDVFNHGYRPSGVDPECSMPLILSEWASIRSQAMEVGNDALTLLHVGSVNSDRRVILAGHRKYLATIHYVKSELNSPHSDFDGILAAAHDLLCMEIYRAVSPSENAWAKHGPGLTAIAIACCRQPGHNAFRSFLFWQLRHVNLMQALVSRQPATRGEHGWFLGEKIPSADSVETLVRTTMQLPGLLYQLDRLDHSSGTRHDSALRIWDALGEIAILHQAWITTFCSTRRMNVGIPGQGVSSTPPSSGTTDRTVATDGFPSFLTASCVVFHWCCMLVIEQARFELCSILAVEEQQRHRAAADRYAELIWSSVPYLQREAGGPVSKAASANGALHFLACWFDKSSNVAQLERCQCLRKKIQEEMPFLQWNALLPYSFLSILWLS